MKKEPFPEDGRERRREEVKALKKCKHENIVEYFEDFYEKDHTMIVMEYCCGGDLAKLIEQQKQEGPFREDVVIQYALDLAFAMQYMKSQRIIHRDLKPDNIFVTYHKTLKIGDFGLARCLDR